MCGIVGFTGTQQAAPILLNGLSKLEYRGYDSAGIAVRDGEHLAQVVKAKGRLSNLIEKTDEGKALIGTCGIGHTRWATHGEPSQINAHPHVSGNCTRSGSGEVESEVVGVHNGIIENYTELKEKLLKHGYTFYVDLVLFAFENGTSGDILVQKAPACTIEVLAKAVTELFAPGHEIKVIGIRHGEKMYETLLTNEECANAIDMGEFYRVPCDKRDLNYDKYFKEGDVERNILTEFNSSNTELLDVEQVKEKLLTLQYIRDELAEWENR